MKYVMAFEKDFVKPKHPLPKEIQEMKRDETVCQFCGVSYLIHNEIKKLEDEIVQLKSELEKYRGYDEREAELKSKLKDENIKFQLIEKDLRQEKQRNESLIKEMSALSKLKSQAEAERDSSKCDMQNCVYQITEVKSKNKKLYSSMGYFHEIVNCIKGDLAHLVTDTKRQREHIDEYVINSGKFVDLVREKYWNEKKQFLTDNEQLKTTLAGSQKNVQEMEVKIAEMNNQAQASKDLEAGLQLRLQELEMLKSERKKVEMENGVLSDAVKKMKTALSEKTRKLEETQSFVQVAEDALKIAKDRETNQQESRRQEIENLHARIKDLENELENLKSSQKEETEAVATRSLQIKVLKECLDKSKKEVALLTKERGDMIEAHQNRIKQLRESFNQKMLEADVWPKKLEEKLEEQQHKFNEEKTEMWKELMASFQKEMEQANDAHAKEKLIIEEKEKLHTFKMREQLETLQRRSKEELDSCKAKLSWEKEKHEKINRSQEALIHNLELKISDMEMRLAGLQQKTTEEDLSYKQKYMDTKRALEDLREDFNRIEKELTSNKREIDVLQETVRRECEERFELTEALSDARMQLLAMQKRPLAKLNNNTLVPSPPATTNNDRNVLKEKFLRSKRMESMEQRISSTHCSVTQDSGITFDKTASHEENARKRIAEAVAKQRASSRASYDKF